MRGVAALAVFAYHSRNPTFKSLLPVAYVAVDFFFVLSGFVLAHAYAERLRTGMGAVEFMVRRYIRFMPLYLLGCTVGFAVAVGYGWSAGALAFTAIFALLLLPRPTHMLEEKPCFPYNGPAWSLFFELVANAIFAVVGRFLTWRVLGALLAAGAAMVIAAKIHYGPFSLGGTWYEFPGALSRVIWSFFAGVAIHRLWLARPAPAAPPLIYVVALVAMLAIRQELLWVLLGFPLLVYLAASAEPRAWSAGLFSRLGVISYGLYSLHQPVIDLLRQRGMSVENPLLIAGLGAVLVGAVLLLDRWYDLPARRLLERTVLPWFARRRAAKRDALSAAN